MIAKLEVIRELVVSACERETLPLINTDGTFIRNGFICVIGNKQANLPRRHGENRRKEMS